MPAGSAKAIDVIKTGIDLYFGITASGSTFGKELRAGLTTFLTMSYILFVNPTILGAAIPVGLPHLMAATALAAAFGTLIMGLVARYPFALAPGMGLNAYFAYSVVLGQGIPWQLALGAVFISGLLFLLLSLAGTRQALIDAIPASLKAAITAGIGLFLATIGLVNGGLVVAHKQTLVTLGDLASPAALIALIGLATMGVLMALRVSGAILIGILTASITAIISGAPVYNGQAFAGFSQGLVRAPAMPGELFLALDLSGALGMGVLTIVFTFLFVDFFDTTGTLIALSYKTGKLDGKGRLPRARAAFCADAMATSVGALLGTSSTTSYIESASGIEEGGRTGLTAVFVALLFLLSLFLWPLAEIVPQAATAPALITIGALMMFTTTKIKWDEHGEALPAFLTIIGMPLTYSITNGISLGIVAYCLINLFSGRGGKVHWLLYLLAVLLILRFAFLSA